jgi:SH3-like domain-containing protein
MHQMIRMHPHTLRYALLNFLVLITCSLGFLMPALAQSMVSVKGETVNLRAAPSTNAEITWQLKKGYPLKVVKRQGDWLQVKDFENDSGWIARNLTARTPHHVVKAKIVNLRNGPGEQHRVVARLTYGEVVRTLEHRNNWVRVEQPNGPRGWVSKKLLWGW